MPKNDDEWVLVPRHPTREMLDAAWASALAEDAEGVWVAMIDAAPNRPASEIPAP